jgi:leucine-rich repeat protein SHOC2
LQDLKKLNLSENYLNGPLSSHACELPKLEVLHLDANRITSLPPNCGSWSHLKVITLADNKITTLPEESSEWTKLLYLNIKNNGLAELSGDIVKNWEQVYAFLL